MKRTCAAACCLAMLSLPPLMASEDWQCVYPGKTAYFEDAGKMVYTVRIDSVRDDGKTLYPFSDFRQVDDECYSATSGSWIARRIVLDEDGNTVFVTGEDLPFLVRNKARLGDTWDAFSNGRIKVRGQVTANEPQTVLGMTDSVKTITFSVFDLNGKPVSHMLDAQSIRISKTLGLVRTFNFYRLENDRYPDGDIAFGWFDLIGTSEPQLGFKPINQKELYFDFQAGDEFHIYCLDNPMGTARRVESKTINTYLSRTDYDDRVVYSYESKVSRTEQLEDKTVHTTVTTDVIRQEITKGLLFNTAPNEPYDDGNVLKKVMIRNGDLPKMYVWNSRATRDIGTSCYRQGWADVCAIPDYYAPGLGHVHDGCCEVFDNEQCHRLVYYKKGGTEVGTPLELPSGVGTVHGRGVRVAVADGFITVTLEQAHAARLSLYDMGGRLRHEQAANSSVVHIPATTLPDGMYLLRVADMESNTNHMEKLVVNGNTVRKTARQ